MQIQNGIITFTNADPRVYDGLGEIDWQAPAKCENCGETECFNSWSNWYDGCLREMPYCENCNKQARGLPVDPTARAIMETARREAGQQ